MAKRFLYNGVYECPSCGARFELDDESDPTCPECGEELELDENEDE